MARELLGKILVRRINRREIRGIITETEAYVGPHDLASHSSRGLTPRTAVMFGPPGRWYVYLNYGIHWLLNIVTGREGTASAVLFRSVDFMEGPGRLSRAFHVDKSLNAKAASRADGLWIEDAGIKLPRGAVKTSSRIGVDYAGPIWSKKHLRFFIPKEVLTNMLAATKFKPMTRRAINITKKSKKTSGGGRASIS